jgi:hypothetical protein
LCGAAFAFHAAGLCDDSFQRGPKRFVRKNFAFIAAVVGSNVHGIVSLSFSREESP